MITGIRMNKKYTRIVHSSLSVVTRAPFHASMLRPASRLAQWMSPWGWGKLVNAALLSLINEACVNVCCATSSRVKSSAMLMSRHDRVTREAGRVGLMGRDRGGEDIPGILSDVVPVYFNYLYCPVVVSVFL